MPNAPLTCLDLWIKAGSLYEEKGEEGLAHFLEHMVFKGGENLKEGDFDRQIEALGGSSNAATGFDDVHFHVLIPPEAIEQALDLLLNLVLTPSFDSKAYEIEREVVLEEIAQHNDQQDEKIFQKLLELCWKDHAYGRPILGYKESLVKSNPKTMRGFHNRCYSSDNFVLSIAGNLPNGIEDIVQKSQLSTVEQSSIKSQANPKIKKIPFHKGRTEIEFDRIETSRIIMAWPFSSAKYQSFVIGADIATSLLAEGRRSRLVKHLREELQIVDSIEMDITILENGGLVILEASCKEENLSYVEAEIHNLLKESIEKPIKEKELKRAKKLVSNSLCFSLELSSNVAAIAGSQALWGRHQPLLSQLDLINYWNKDKIKDEIFSLFQPSDSCILIANPKK